MSKKTALAAAITGLAMGLAIGALALYTSSSIAQPQQPPIDNYRVLIEKPYALESEAKPITLHEAWDVTLTYAREWGEDAALIYLVSADVDDPDAGEVGQGHQRQLGQDGRRRTWQAALTSSRLGKQLFLQITDSVIIEAIEDGIHDPGIPTIAEKPAMDSAEAIAQARTAEPGFGTSVGRGQGYHFILQTDDNGKVTLTVVGSHRIGNTQSPAIVEIDPETGELEFRETE